jgi:hypothetical protein
MEPSCTTDDPLTRIPCDNTTNIRLGQGPVVVMAHEAGCGPS